MILLPNNNQYIHVEFYSNTVKSTFSELIRQKYTSIPGYVSKPSPNDSDRNIQTHGSFIIKVLTSQEKRSSLTEYAGLQVSTLNLLIID